MAHGKRQPGHAQATLEWASCGAHIVRMSQLKPDQLVHRFEPDEDTVHVLAVDRAARARAAFLTDDELKPSGPPRIVRRAEALAGVAGQAGPLAFIFHSAFCCSTLLANAYDRPGCATSLKEPMLLQDIVGWRQRGADPNAVGVRLSDALTLLARPFERGETMVIKPSNVVSGLMPAMLAARPDARAVLLHAPLPLYLNSIARKGLRGRGWVRDLLHKQLIDGSVALGFETQDYFLQTDLQVAAVGWLAQHALFARVAKAWPDRIRTLDSEVMLARPEEALAALDELFGIDDDAESRAEVIRREFGRNSKFGHSFSRQQREAEQRAAASAHAEEIDLVVRWAIEVARAAAVTIDLPQPLLCQ